MRLEYLKMLKGGTGLAGRLFCFFLTGFTLDTQSRHWTGFQTFVGNIPLTTFANTVGLRRESIDRLINLLEEFPLSLANAKRKMLIGFGGSLVTHVRKHFQTGGIRQHHSGLSQNRRTLSLEVTQDIGVLDPVVCGGLLPTCGGFFLPESSSNTRYRYAGIVFRP